MNNSPSRSRPEAGLIVGGQVACLAIRSEWSWPSASDLRYMMPRPAANWSRYLIPDREAIAAPRSHSWTHLQARRPPGRHSAPLADKGKAAGCASPVPRVKFVPEALVRSRYGGLFDPRATREVSVARALAALPQNSRTTNSDAKKDVGRDCPLSSRWLSTSNAVCSGLLPVRPVAWNVGRRAFRALGFTRELSPSTANYEFKRHER
jgi:hypothetical protein